MAPLGWRGKLTGSATHVHPPTTITDQILRHAFYALGAARIQLVFTVFAAINRIFAGKRLDQAIFCIQAMFKFFCWASPFLGHALFLG